MRAAILERAPGGLHIEEIPVPEPRAGEILVKVPPAASVTPTCT